MPIIIIIIIIIIISITMITIRNTIILMNVQMYKM